ncbi:MAG: hypothetical protein WEF50_21475 [Myxococcota bacterium]
MKNARYPCPEKLTLATVLSVVILIGCISSYAGEFLIVPHSDSTADHAEARVTDADVEMAVKTTASIALDFNMKERPPVSEEIVRQLMEQYGFRPIASYSFPGSRRGLFLSVSLPNDRSNIEIVIRDIDHPDETEFTRRLRDRLATRLAQEFPSHEVRFTQSQVDASFAP